LDIAWKKLGAPIMNNALSVEFLQQASDVIKVLGHPQRLKIIEYLEKGEKSVSQIQEHLSVSQPLASQYLRHMHSRGIVKYRREGTTYFYSIASEFIHKILDCVSECQQKVESGEWELAMFGTE
jgi:ArsR family transcriptional regulator|tara:strand:+ start:1185 stop:1556 length:372 start_codon:yes stop_codon:yes gene_type:complete